MIAGAEQIPRGAVKERRGDLLLVTRAAVLEQTVAQDDDAGLSLRLNERRAPHLIREGEETLAEHAAVLRWLLQLLIHWKRSYRAGRAPWSCRVVG